MTYLLPGPWWAFYPLVGIDITDSEPDLDTPLFGDCTIISRRHIERVVDWLYQNRDLRVQDTQWQTGALLRELERLAGSEFFDSMLAVRSTGALDSRELDHNNLEIKTGVRAREVSSCLALVFLARRHHPSTFSLVEQKHYNIRTYRLVNARTGYLFAWGDDQVSQVGVAHPAFITVSRAELLQVVQEEPYNDLCSILLNHKQLGIPYPFVETLTSSASRIIDALNDRDPATSLLSTVIALEVLLRAAGAENESYHAIKRRMSALLGQEAVDNYDPEIVLRSRHQVVHFGSEVEGYFTIPIRAVGLAAACLFRYASAGLHIRNKPALLSYLDMIVASDKVQQFWSASDRASFSNLLKHKRSGIYYTWQTRTLDLRFRPYKRAKQ